MPHRAPQPPPWQPDKSGKPARRGHGVPKPANAVKPAPPPPPPPKKTGGEQTDHKQGGSGDDGQSQ